MTHAAITIQNLDHRFEKRKVLNNINFDLHPGETLGFLGPNGSGKTTLFSLLTGLLSVQHGEIFFEGSPQSSSTQKFRSQLGVIFQNPSLDPKLTATENLSLAACLHAVPSSEAKHRIQKLLSQVGLTNRSQDPIHTYSGGMKRRCDIARALIHQPKILILDEPTTGLDEAMFREIWNMLQTLRQEYHVSILLSTHRAEEAQLCSRVAILSQGTIQVIDTPATLRKKISTDIIALKGENPQAICHTIQQKFNFSSLIHQEEILIECERGHEWIPRIVEAFPAGTLHSVNLREPSLADVFLKITGHALC